MRLDLPYGTDTIHFELPEENLSEIVGPNEVEIGDEDALVAAALENPAGPETFERFLADAEDLLVIVNDGTRPTPTAKVLSVIYDRIGKIEDHRFIVATGTHRAPTPAEYLQIFGELYETVKDRVHVHDSRKDAELVQIGRSKAGTEMLINRLAVEAGKILIIGSVEPHYFAGYTGGRKALFPGIAGHKTITQNHKYALDVRSQALALSGNPVHDDLEDAADQISKPIFSIMAVLDKSDRIYAVTAGDLKASFHKAVERAGEVFSVKIKEKVDIVISVAPYPMDIDLYQAQKAIENGKLALKDNGILILVSKCRMGVGDDAFVKLLSQAKSPGEVLELIRQEYQLGDHKAAKLAETSLWAQMWGVTDIDPEIMNTIFIRPCKSIQFAVDEALQEKGPAAKVLVLLSGSIVVPRV